MFNVCVVVEVHAPEFEKGALMVLVNCQHSRLVYMRIDIDNAVAGASLRHLA